MLCLICCCDTSDIGSAAQLNRLNEKEIELYQKQLKKEMDRRNTIKNMQDGGGVASDGTKNVNVIPGTNPIASAGSK